MDDNRIKYLEMIQNVITRMNSNSFDIKKWTIGILSGLCALYVNSSNKNILFIALVIMCLMWFLDGIYLHQERQYRELYLEAKNGNVDDFNMNASKYHSSPCCFIKVLFSKTLIPVYFIPGILLAVFLYYYGMI